MKFLFIIQGDGRGHMTQALAMKGMLDRNGHQVTEVLIGKSPLREIPSFFTQKIATPVTTFESPNFSPTQQNRRPPLWKSILLGLLQAPRFLKSMRLIRDRIIVNNPDVVVNFFDLLGGLTYVRYSIRIPMVCVGHQYLLEHPGFEFPSGKRGQAKLVRLLTYLTSIRADLKLALSLEPMEHLPDRRTKVVPPLMREDILRIKPSKEEFILGYMVNPGFLDEVVAWHNRFPETVAHFFWDRKNVSPLYQVQKNLTFHKINDEKFIDLLSRCSGYATTGGFESVCEAMYLGKPVMMVPAHIEQECNAHDAARHGAGIVSETFAIEKLTGYIPTYEPSIYFREWVMEAESVFMRHLTSIPSKTREKNHRFKRLQPAWSSY